MVGLKSDTFLTMKNLFIDNLQLHKQGVVEKFKMTSLEILIEEVKKCLKLQNNLAAFFIALCIPDICRDKSNENKIIGYIEWFNKYVGESFFYMDNVPETYKAGGSICYQLRNAFYHNFGETKMNKSKKIINSCDISAIRIDNKAGPTDLFLASFEYNNTRKDDRIVDTQIKMTLNAAKFSSLVIDGAKKYLEDNSNIIRSNDYIIDCTFSDDM